MFPGSAALAGTCQAPWWGSPSCSCSLAWILTGGREGPSRVAGPGWLVFHMLPRPPIKEFSLLKALEEEKEGRKLCVKPIFNACWELQSSQAPELSKRGSCLPPAALL